MYNIKIYHYQCPLCLESTECEIDIDEHYLDLPDSCPHCTRPISEEEKLRVSTHAEIDVRAQQMDCVYEQMRERV